MNFNENTRVKIPAILHLCRLGYKYLPLGGAKYDQDTNIFTDVFSESMCRINPDLDANIILPGRPKFSTKISKVFVIL
jgi:type I restriction enzyme R subunit